MAQVLQVSVEEALQQPELQVLPLLPLQVLEVQQVLQCVAVPVSLLVADLFQQYEPEAPALELAVLP